MKGSFTGAYRDKPGKLQLAHRGTLFLDEVGEMSLRMQALLLRFLENGEVQSVGADHVQTKVDVRVIAATNRVLADMVTNGTVPRRPAVPAARHPHPRAAAARAARRHPAARASSWCRSPGATASSARPRSRCSSATGGPATCASCRTSSSSRCGCRTAAAWRSSHLPPAVQAAGDAAAPMRERRRQVSDELYTALVSGGYSFWEHIHPLFLARDITRYDMRCLVRKGLSTTRGNYRSLLRLFGLPTQDYKRFLNFLAAHDCTVDFREFRQGSPPPLGSPRLLPPLEVRATADVESPEPGDKGSAPSPVA